MNLHKFVCFGYGSMFLVYFYWIISCFFVNGFLIWVISCFLCKWVSDLAPPKPQPKWYPLIFLMFKFKLENGSDLCFWHLGFEKTVSF